MNDYNEIRDLIESKDTTINDKVIKIHLRILGLADEYFDDFIELDRVCRAYCKSFNLFSLDKEILQVLFDSYDASALEYAKGNDTQERMALLHCAKCIGISKNEIERLKLDDHDIIQVIPDFARKYRTATEQNP